MIAAPDAPSPPILAWWQRRSYAAALVLLAAVPLLWPPLPPLTDLIGHMGRYHVELAIGRSPFLHQWFTFRWALMGNLGVDLLIVPVAKLFGLELGVKLIALAIPPLTVFGLLLIAREVHGRLPPTAAFALPLAYGFPFQYGFINFVLSMALALIAFGVWLRLGRLGRRTLRAALFVPVAAIIWLAHSYGWGVLGLLAFGAELHEGRRAGAGWVRAAWNAGFSCLPLAPPLLLMILWRSENVAGSTGDFLDWNAKRIWILSILREWSLPYDLLSAVLLYVLAIAGAARLRLGMDPKLGTAAAVLLLAFLTIPRILLGSAYADMRLAPFMVAIAVIALNAGRLGRREAGLVALAALGFYGMRLTGTTITYLDRARVYARQLGALPHIAPGSRVMVLVNLPCVGHWGLERTDQLGSMAIIRRDAFANGQWDMPGAQLLRVTYNPEGVWGVDPSQIRRPADCSHQLPIDRAIAAFPRDRFDYLWLIDYPVARAPRLPWLRPLWQGERSGLLYRIVTSEGSPPPAPIRSRTT